MFSSMFPCTHHHTGCGSLVGPYQTSPHITGHHIPLHPAIMPVLIAIAPINPYALLSTGHCSPCDILNQSCRHHPRRRCQHHRTGRGGGRSGSTMGYHPLNSPTESFGTSPRSPLIDEGEGSEATEAYSPPEDYAVLNIQLRASPYDEQQNQTQDAATQTLATPDEPLTRTEPAPEIRINGIPSVAHQAQEQSSNASSSNQPLEMQRRRRLPPPLRRSGAVMNLHDEEEIRIANERANSHTYT